MALHSGLFLFPSSLSNTAPKARPLTFSRSNFVQTLISNCSVYCPPTPRTIFSVLFLSEGSCAQAGLEFSMQPMWPQASSSISSGLALQHVPPHLALQSFLSFTKGLLHFIFRKKCRPNMNNLTGIHIHSRHCLQLG